MTDDQTNVATVKTYQPTNSTTLMNDQIFDTPTAKAYIQKNYLPLSQPLKYGHILALYFKYAKNYNASVGELQEVIAPAKVERSAIIRIMSKESKNFQTIRKSIKKKPYVLYKYLSKNINTATFFTCKSRSVKTDPALLQVNLRSKTPICQVCQLKEKSITKFKGIVGLLEATNTEKERSILKLERILTSLDGTNTETNNFEPQTDKYRSYQLEAECIHELKVKIVSLETTNTDLKQHNCHLVEHNNCLKEHNTWLLKTVNRAGKNVNFPETDILEPLISL